MNEYTFAQLTHGHKESFTKKISDEDIQSFSKISGDKNPLHLDSTYAASTKFGKPVAFGMLTASLLSTLAGMYLPGKYSIILSVETKFMKPVFVHDVLTVIGVVDKKMEVGKVLDLQVTIHNQSQEKVLSGKMLVQVLQ